MEVNLNKLIIPHFHDAVSSIIDCKYDEVILKGGRSSTKSIAVAFSIILGVMVYRQSALCVVKYAVGIENRLVNVIRSCIDMLGVERYFKLKRSPFEYILLDNKGKETNISIMFKGADNPDTLKSMKPRSGSFRYLWIEEAVDFRNFEELQNLSLTVLRGEGKHCMVVSYNPPKSSNHWLNKRYNKDIGKALGYESDTFKGEYKYELNGKQYVKTLYVNHSTYLDVINSGHEEWLGGLLVNALQSKENNKKYYEWQYLGKVVGTDANVFNNITDWIYDDEVSYGQVRRGLDCSNGGPDPWMYTEVYYDKKKNDLYVLNEKRLGGTVSLEDVAVMIKPMAGHGDIYIDSAVPIFCRKLNSLGLNTIPVKKGKDSVASGILFIQSMNHVFIDKRRCPNTYKEMFEYEYLINKDNEIMSELPDKNNHSIDALRYALCMLIRYGNDF